MVPITTEVIEDLSGEQKIVAKLIGDDVDEIKKCVVRCANCHRRKTASEGNHWKILLLKELVGPVGLEPTLGFLPLIKSQVSASNSSTTP